MIDKAIGCIGSTIKVFAGHYVDLVSLRPEDVDLESIATALSRICRYGGHCPEYYSVSEHCYLATRLAIQDCQPIEIQRAVFLHDAAEGYLGDIVKPLKLVIGDEYARLEGRVDAAISERFWVDILKHYDTYKMYDLQMLKAEKLAMWPDDEHEWAGLGSIVDRKVLFRFWDHETARRHFLSMAKALDIT